MKKTTFAIFYLVIFLLGACSNGGNIISSANQTTDASKLNIINPNTLLSLSDRENYGYVMILNPTATIITGLTYSLGSTIGGGSQVTLDPKSTAACNSVAANGRCALKLVVPAGTIAGSVHLTLNNQSTGATTGQNSVVIGVTQAQYASSSNEVNTYFYPKVIAGTKYVMVTGFVPSQNITPFNMVHLTDGNGNSLPGQEAISGNLGAGLTNLGQGGTFSILLPVSHRNSNQTIKLKLSSVAPGGALQNQVLQKQTSNIEVVEEQRALISTLPSLVNLTTTNPSQTITIYNSGNKSAQLQSLETSNANLKISFSPTELAPGATTTATVSLNNPITSSVSSGLTLRLNNGLNNTSHAITIEQNINQKLTSAVKSLNANKASNSIGSEPYAGLVLNFNPNFVTNTTTGTISNRMVLINTGNTPESNFSIILPNSNFSISTATIESNITPCQISGNTIQTILGTNSSNNSCSIFVSYTNNQLTPETSGNISVNYQYYNGSKSSSITQPVNYEVTQSGAILNISPTQQYFGNILNNGVATSNIYQFVISNSGQTTANNIVESITGTAKQLFNIVPVPSNPSACGSSLASGKFCIIGVQFGPTPESGYLAANSESANLMISYANLDNLTYTESSALVGNVIQAVGANISSSITAVSNNVYEGPGISADKAYQVAINTIGSLTYTYTNSGTTANDFYVSANGLQNGWSISNNNCGTASSPITLNNGASCTITFQLLTTNQGANNLPQNLIQANWSDQVYPKGTSLISSTQPVYVNVYTGSLIQISTSQGSPQNVGIVGPTDSFNINATLIGGYQVQNEIINFTSSQLFESLSANSCQLSSTNNNCSVTVTTPMVVTKLGPTTQNLINGPITINITGNNITPVPSFVYISGTSTFPTQNWATVVTGSTIPYQQFPGNSPVLMAVDINNVLYYADNSGVVWQNINGTFTNIAHFNDSYASNGLQALAAASTGFIGVAGEGGTDCFTNCSGAFWTWNSATGTLTTHSPWDAGHTFPTTAIYSPGIQRFYWGDSEGAFHWVSTYDGGHTDFADNEDCDGVLSVAMGPGSIPNFYAVCVNFDDNTLEIENTQLFACGQDGPCWSIATDNQPGTITSDGSGNIYAGWSFNGITSYPNGANINAFSFINPSSMPTSLINPTYPNPYNNSYYCGNLVCNLTQVAWDQANNRLLALYNYGNYVNLVAYNPTTGIVDPSVTFPALPELPYFPGVVHSLSDMPYLEGQNSGLPIAPTALVVAGNTVYYMGASGTIYSLQY